MRQFFRCQTFRQALGQILVQPRGQAVRRCLGGLLALALTLLLLVRIAQAACGGSNLSDFCSSNFGLSGDLSAVGSPTSNSFPTVDNSQLPMAGALFYADYKALEEQARDLLERNMKFRQDISPYRTNNNFNKLVRQFDVNSGFTAIYDDPDQNIGPMTLQQRIDLADADLRQARDLYAVPGRLCPRSAPAGGRRHGLRCPGADYKEHSAPRPKTPTRPTRNTAVRCSTQ